MIDGFNPKFHYSTLYITLGDNERRLLNFVGDFWGERFGPKVILYAQMLIGKFERYGVTRDFIIRDMVIAPKN